MKRTKEAQYSVYMLQCGDGTLYTGIAKDVHKRLREHSAGRGARYTRGRGPLALVHLEQGFTHGDALSREAAVKRLSRERKSALIQEESTRALLASEVEKKANATSVQKRYSTKGTPKSASRKAGARSKKSRKGSRPIR